MSFALEIKNEILLKEFSNEKTKSFLDGVASSSKHSNDDKIILKFSNNEILDLIKQMFENINVEYSTSSKNPNWIEIDGYKFNKEITDPSAFFGGVFVGGGSVSDVNSTSYHLEMGFESSLEAKKTLNFLNNYPSFDFTLTQRRLKWIVYIKKSEQISDFFKAIEAQTSLMRFENVRIERDFNNQLNRYSNLDVYNQSKLAKSSAEFIAQYELIVENGLESEFRDIEIRFFEIKKENPYLSLTELTEIFEEETGVHKTRAGLNHWIRKLRQKIEDFNL